MAFSQSDLTAIDTAIATGEMMVEIDGKRVTYRSISELKDARGLIQSSLISAGVVTAKSRTTYAARSRE